MQLSYGFYHLQPNACLTHCLSDGTGFKVLLWCFQFILLPSCNSRGQPEGASHCQACCQHFPSIHSKLVLAHSQPCKLTLASSMLPLARKGSKVPGLQSLSYYTRLTMGGPSPQRYDCTNYTVPQTNNQNGEAPSRRA